MDLVRIKKEKDYRAIIMIFYVLTVSFNCIKFTKYISLHDNNQSENLVDTSKNYANHKITNSSMKTPRRPVKNVFNVYKCHTTIMKLHVSIRLCAAIPTSEFILWDSFCTAP